MRRGLPLMILVATADPHPSRAPHGGNTGPSGFPSPNEHPIRGKATFVSADHPPREYRVTPRTPVLFLERAVVCDEGRGGWWHEILETLRGRETAAFDGTRGPVSLLLHACWDGFCQPSSLSYDQCSPGLREEED
ncbi:hypothetical protein VUR80DRAFT_5944 [Thermomyces stellatus]